MSPAARAGEAGPDHWTHEWAGGFGRARELLAWLGLEPAAVGLSEAAADRFAFRVTRSFARRMRRGDPADPLLRQVLPATDELLPAPGFSQDPVGDLGSRRAPGLLHKYHGRALLVTTASCAIHCRYCFRREFPYESNRLEPRDQAATLAAIAADPSLQEIILSGGDPLALDDHRLEALFAELSRIPQLRRLRMHTRLPVVLPARIGDHLLRLLDDCPLPVTVVIHANHAQELDAEVESALGRLRMACAALLNQSVLLRGVNDSVESLAELSERLFACGVLPYYLHQLDRVSGAAHFEVSDDEAIALARALGARLPGYLVPRLVREIAGEPAKTPLALT
ncbi:MAG: EF-P beta-lysylation protein EpmB [Chromatiales bacterium]|nr:EF-P beta-lysylation protein EpmB [Chromatiales bacterium]